MRNASPPNFRIAALAPAIVVETIPVFVATASKFAVIPVKKLLICAVGRVPVIVWNAPRKAATVSGASSALIEALRCLERNVNSASARAVSASAWILSDLSLRSNADITLSTSLLSNPAFRRPDRTFSTIPSIERIAVRMESSMFWPSAWASRYVLMKESRITEDWFFIIVWISREPFLV